MTIGKDLPAPYPRRIVPADADLGDWSAIEPLFKLLEQASPATVSALEDWLLDMNDLVTALDEEGSRRYVIMTGHTDDKDCEKHYLQFVNEIDPRRKKAFFELLKKYASLPARQDLPKPRYLVLDRSFMNEVELFRTKNVALELKEENLRVDQQKVTGAMTVTFKGSEYTIQQIGKFMDENDRATRQAAWELSANRYLQDRSKLDDIFDRLLKLRQEEARNAGFADYRAYAFRQRERFDYGVEECLQFHEAVEKVVTPLSRQLQERRRKAMGLEKLRPWDLAVDPQGRPPLRPFSTPAQLVEGCREILNRVHPDFGKLLAFLHEHELLDLESRKGKAPGGYQTILAEYRLPFIFMNAVGVHGDVATLLHESGHAVHSMECQKEPLLAYRGAGAEFSELASQGMELLGSEHYEVFYSPADAERARLKEMEDHLRFFCWCERIDAFQHWVYTHPGHSVEERQAQWLDLNRRFGGIEDITGYEDWAKSSWHRQLHIFLYPFYYIEYGISLLGALQVWTAAQKDKASAIAAFRRGLALGGSRPLPELFSAAGLRFDFSEQTIKPLITGLARRLGMEV